MWPWGKAALAMAAFAAFISLMSFSPPAEAEAIYSYTGNPFTTSISAKREYLALLIHCPTAIS